MLKSGQTWIENFTTPNSSNVPSAPSGTPTCTLYINGTANGATVTVSSVGTGHYKFSVTVPASSSGQSAQMYTTYTLDGNAVGRYLSSQMIDTAYVSETGWDEILTGATHNIANSAGKRLRQIASSIIYSGTAVSATSNTITLDSGASSNNGAYDPALIYIESGTGAGQSRLILEYVGATRKAILDRAWKTIPDNTSDFVIHGEIGREHVNEGLAQGATSTSITLNANASSLNDAYNGQVVFVRSGTGEDQARRITDYNGTTKVATVSAWGTIPDTTSAYVILPHTTGLPTADEIATATNNPTGTYSYSNTVVDGDNDPIDGVLVELYSDENYTTRVTSTYSKANGSFTVYSDTAGTYYLRLQLGNYNVKEMEVTLA